jgi:hypothetical protein
MGELEVGAERKRLSAAGLPRVEDDVKKSYSQPNFTERWILGQIIKEFPRSIFVAP